MVVKSRLPYGENHVTFSVLLEKVAYPSLPKRQLCSIVVYIFVESNLHENPVSPAAPSVKLPHLSFNNQYCDQVHVYQDNLMPKDIRSEFRELLPKYDSFTHVEEVARRILGNIVQEDVIAKIADHVEVIHL